MAKNLDVKYSFIYRYKKAPLLASGRPWAAASKEIDTLSDGKHWL